MLMREQGQDLIIAKNRAKRLLNVPALIKIIGARGKTEIVYGKISALFPAVFTITIDDATTRTFSYAEILTGNILFLNPEKTK